MATLAGRFKCDAGNTLDLKTVVHLGIKRFFILSATFAAFWLTEIDAAGQFAHTGCQSRLRQCQHAADRMLPALIQFCRTQIAE